MKVVDALRPLLHLVAYYPLLLVVVVALFTLVFGVVLEEYDAFHLIWHESPLTGMTNGALVSFVLGLAMMSAEVADTRAAARAGGPAPADGPYRLAWGLLQLLFALPMVGRGSAPLDGVTESSAWRWWFPAGMAAASGAYLLARAVRPAAFAATATVGQWVLAALAVGYVAMIGLHASVPDSYCPYFSASVSVLLFLSFLTAGLGAMTVLAQARARWLYPVVLAVVVIPFAFPRNQVENRLPHMTDSAGKDYYDAPARLANYDALRAGTGGGLATDAEALAAWNERMKEEFNSPQPLVLVACSGGASASAIYTADVLFTLESSCPGFAKRIRLVSGASGGMLGAAYFVSQLRPGGLIAAAQADPAYLRYRDLLRAGASPTAPEFAAAEAAYRDVMANLRQRFFRGLEADFLGPLVQKWVHKDAPLSPTGLLSRLDRRLGHTTNDRGAALERAWAAHQATAANPALDVPFAALREQERRGDLPSLVFTPMMIEDGRQLIVSNLNLDYMVETGKRGEVLPGVPDYLSYMGVEFFKLFPAADQFKLSTAVRMNASFPLFSPAVALPTDPVRHVVDAGYYDNYGMVVATKWLSNPANHDFLARKYSDDKAAAGKSPEVLLLRIRCFGDQQTPLMIPTAAELERYAGRPVPPTELGATADRWEAERADFPAVHTESGLFTVNAPLTGLFAAWRANMAYRSDERLAAVLREYEKEIPNRAGVRVKVKVSEYPLFCRVEPSLNWVLTRRDIDAIHEDVRRDLAGTVAWANFYSGRGTNPDPTIATAAPPAAPQPLPPDAPYAARVAAEQRTTAYVREARKKESDAGKVARPETLTPSQKASLAAKIDLASKMSQMAVPKK